MKPTTADAKRRVKKPNKQTISVAIVLTFFIASVWLGMVLERSRTPEPLPANILCLNVAKETPKFYKAKIDEVFGIPTPKDSPTRDQLKKLIKDCEDNVQNYSITLEGK